MSKLGLDEFDCFLFADHRVVQINLHTGQGRWSLFTNRHELSYFQHGYHKPTMPQGDGINDLEQLAKAIGYSKYYLKDEAWDRIKELTSKESLAMLGVFASVWVGSQFTPVGWAADALVLVLTIGGCILLGPHLLEVSSLLESFYKKATNAGRNEAQYRSAGEDFAKVVTLVGVDVLMVLVFHVAKAPVNRLVVRVKQGGVGKLPGAKPAPVEEPLESSVDYAGKGSDPHTGKPQSGRTGYLRSPRLSRSQLAKFKAKAQNIGVDLEVVKDKRILKMMDENGAQAAFDRATGKIYVRPGATYYEVAHEMAHAEQYAKIGKGAYEKLSRLEKETHVYEELMKQKDKLTEVEIHNALDYINYVRSQFALSPLKH